MRSAKWSSISHWSCCNIGYQPETHHELKSREISFAPESFLTCQIVCKYYTKQCSNTVLPYSVWNIKMTGQKRNRLWARISLDSCLRWMSMWYALLQQSMGPWNVGYANNKQSTMRRTGMCQRRRTWNNRNEQVSWFGCRFFNLVCCKHDG